MKFQLSDITAVMIEETEEIMIDVHGLMADDFRMGRGHVYLHPSTQFYFLIHGVYHKCMDKIELIKFREQIIKLFDKGYMDDRFDYPAICFKKVNG